MWVAIDIEPLCILLYAIKQGIVNNALAIGIGYHMHSQCKWYASPTHTKIINCKLGGGIIQL